MDSIENSGVKTQSNEDENYNLLIQANECFTNKAYDNCLELLKQLEIKGDSNSQILKHNRAVVNFYKSDCKDYMKLLIELHKLEPDVEGHESPSLPLKQNFNAIARFNKAVIYYYRHMYFTAMEKLSTLVARLETLDKQIALTVATLYLQLLLSTNQLNRAESFLYYIQNKLNFITPPASPAEEDAEKFGSLEAHNNCSTLQFLSMLTHVLNRKLVVVIEDGSPEYAALKAQQYYIMKDFQMAAKQLMRINEESCQSGKNSAALSTCIANNMGVIHLRVRHYGIATKFFQNALNFDKQIVSNIHDITLKELSLTRSCEILYNLGISMLHLRRARDAFQCFLVPIKFYESNPRLWLRMAEACIMEHETKVQHEKRQLNGSSKSLKQSVSYGAFSQSAAVPEPTLEFAVLCLRNALMLTKHYRKLFNKEDEELPEEDANNDAGTSKLYHDWQQAQDNNFCNPSKPITRESIENLNAAVYAAFSFVSLKLGDYVTALEMAQALLQTERLSDAHKLLGHMYAGEALMFMNKPMEARAHLEPNSVATLNAFDFETRDWQVKSLDAAQNVVRYNLAVAMALQGEYETARSLSNTLTHAIVATHVLTLRKYIESQVGLNASIVLN